MDILSVPTILQNAVVLTVLLALAGYLISSLSMQELARRQDKLRLVNERLNEFYGPLYVASEAGNIAYRSLLERQGKETSDPIRDEGDEGLGAMDDHDLHAIERYSREDHHPEGSPHY